ncbi:MAG: hypothetical protein ACRD0E_07595, partial [Acidimicrobiales bacterium]
MEITFDTDFDPDYPVYTRANAGEVLPDVIGPLGWSLAGPCFEEGFRIALCDNLAALPRPQGRQFQLTGRFAGYFHLNLSALRTAAERLPGTSADAVDRQYLGDAAAHGLPAHGPSSSELWWKARAGVASARTSVTLTHQVAAQRKGLVRLRAQNRELVANGASAGQLLGALRMLSASHSATFGAHVTARALTSSALELATNAMRRCGLGAEEALRRIADIPGLESSKPSRGLVELAHRVANQAEPAGLLASGVCIA